MGHNMRSPYAPQAQIGEAAGRGVGAPAEILDQIVRDGPLTAEEIETASRRFKKALIERALGGELTHHLGYPPGAAKPELATNHRRGRADRSSRSIRSCSSMRSA